MKPRTRQASTLATALVLCAACRAPEQRSYEEAPLEAPDAFLASEVEGQADLGSWWTQFGDERLDEVVEQVLLENHDLAAAAARVDQAAAQARVAGAALYPAVGLSGAAGRQRQNFIGFPIPGSPEGGVTSTTVTTYGLSLDLSWELDLWGKIDAASRAAEADYRASAADLRGARLSLAAQTTKAWFAFAAARLQLDVAERRVTSFSLTSRFLRDRYDQGRVDPLDFRLSESQLASAMAAREAQLEALERVSRQLETLLGDYPAGLLEGPADLPELPGPVPVGLPSELLQRRPDLAASVERLRAADLRLYEAKKMLWPSLSLTASGGRRSDEVDSLTKGAFNIWSLAGNLTQPLFQGGRLRAGVDLSDARVRESLESYSQATLNAFSEVETALAVASHLDARVEDLGEAAGHAAAGEELAESRYLSGRYDILAVLTARRQSFDAETAWINARRERLEARVDLYLALGGGFEDEREDPERDQQDGPGDEPPPPTE